MRIITAIRIIATCAGIYGLIYAKGHALSTSDMVLCIVFSLIFWASLWCKPMYSNRAYIGGVMSLNFAFEFTRSWLHAGFAAKRTKEEALFFLVVLALTTILFFLARGQVRSPAAKNISES
jgi:hypothetical protein